MLKRLVKLYQKISNNLTKVYFSKCIMTSTKTLLRELPRLAFLPSWIPQVEEISKACDSTNFDKIFAT